MATRVLLYDYLLAYATLHGRIPTIKEIQAALGGSRGSVTWNMGKLTKEGLVMRRDREARGIDLVGYRFALVKT